MGRAGKFSRFLFVALLATPLCHAGSSEKKEMSLIFEGYNIVLIGCADYAKGFEGLAGDIRKGLTQGLACANDTTTAGALGHNPELAAAIAKLERALLPEPGKRPIRVYCVKGAHETVKTYDGLNAQLPVGAAAAAWGPGQRGHPTILIPSNPSQGVVGNQMSAAFFHEMFHIAGYGHGSGVDYGYLVPNCCVPDFGDNAQRNLACLLVQAPVDWTGVYYQVGWADYMAGGRGGIADTVAAAKAALKQSANKSLGALMGILETLKFVPGGDILGKRATGWPFSLFLLGATAVGRIGDVDERDLGWSLLNAELDTYYPNDNPENAQIRRYFWEWAEVLNLEFDGKDKGLIFAMKAYFGATASKVLAQLSDSEKKTLDTVFAQ